MSVINWIQKKIADVGIVRLVRPWIANLFTLVSTWLVALGTISPEHVGQFQLSGEAVVAGILTYFIGMLIDTKD